jgi:hypothetical protein
MTGGRQHQGGRMGQRCSPGRDEHRHNACSAMVLSAAAASVADGSRRRRRRGGTEEQRWRCTGSGAVLRQRVWQLRTAPARTRARGRRTVLSGPIFSRTCGDGRAPPHSANEGATGGDTEADRRVPPTTISPI